MENEKTNLPAFWFYPNDFIGSTAHFEVETVGAYIRLLCFQWVNGVLPKNPKHLQGIISCSTEKFAELWSDLSSKFSPVPGGYSNKRLEIERQKAIEYRKNASERGKAGADARWHGQCSSNAQAMPKNSSSSSISISSSLSSSKSKSSSKKTEGNPANAGTPQAEFVTNWAALYKAKTGFDYLATKKDFVLAARLLKASSAAEILDKTKRLFNLCNSRSVWFTNGGMSDFTIGKLSSRWNEIIEGVDHNGKQAGISRSEIESFLEGRK